MIAATSPVVYEDRLPTVTECLEMFESVQWPSYGSAATEAALAGSLCGVVALIDGDVVAMGRVVGDGGKFFYIQDVVVSPEHQRRGIGRNVVRRLLTRIDAIAPGSPFVGVFATPDAIPLYQQLGLEDTFGGLTGMAVVR